MRVLIVSWFMWLAAVAVAMAQPAIQTPSQTLEPSALEQPLDLQVQGTVRIGGSYGLGDGRGLAQHGYSQGFSFNQLLALDLSGTVPVTFPLQGLFSIAAQLNSQQADNLQSLVMHFDSERLILDFGDFAVGERAPDFIVPDRKLKGFKAQWLPESNLTVTAAFARVEGIAESRTFQGNTSADVVTFSAIQEERPWLDQLYLRHLDGLQYYPLAGGFVEGFSKVEFDYHPGPQLEALLGSYELGYLLPGIEADGPVELETGQFQIVRTAQETYLVLMRPALDLLREHVRMAIEEYNLDQLLEGDERKEYPFNEETDFEAGFLQQLQEIVTLNVDPERLSLKGFQRQRFYFLGHRDIVRDTFKLEISVQGQFVGTDDPLLFEYEYELFPEQGLVDLRFPQEFFQDRANQIRAGFNYTSTSGIYILGLSIVKGSDRVFLNGQPLERDLDYTIDYETGALILFRQVSGQDLLRIEYELLRGGLGGFAEYQRNLSQLSVAWEPLPWLTLDLDLLQGADIDSQQDRTRLRTMPNLHNVAGMRAAADLGPLQANAVLGYTLNAFPLDDNLRQNLPNQVNAIRTLQYGSKAFVLFAHQNGLTVFDGVRWTLYDTRAGLSGRSIQDVAVGKEWVALATEAGLTLVRLQGDDPFALIANWLRFYKQDGLADNRVYGVAFDADLLWIATGDGFTKVNVNASLREFEKPEGWTSYTPKQLEGLLAPAITQLAVVDGKVYLASARGLQVFDPQSERLETDGPLLGGAVYDLVGDHEAVYAASDWGLRTLSDGRGTGWLVSGEAVYAVATQGAQVWYAPERGLRSIGAGQVPAPLRDIAIRALGVQGQALWVGPAAGAPPQYGLTITRVQGDGVQAYEDRVTSINGRDLGRFGDVPLGEHLDLGWLGRLEARYALGELSLTSALEGVSPQFTAIGSNSRQDYVRWRLRGDYVPLTILTLFAEHTAGLGSPLTTDAVGLKWTQGLELDVGYHEERSSTQDEVKATFSLNVAKAFLEDAVQWRLSVDDQGVVNTNTQRRSQELTLATSVGVQLTNALRFDLTIQSPLRMRTNRDLSGSLEFSGRAFWAPQLDFGALSVAVEHENENRFPQGRSSRQDQLEVQFNWQSFNWLDVVWIPRSVANFEQDVTGPIDALNRLGLNNSLQARWEQLSGQLNWRRDQVHSSRNQTQSIEHQLSARLNYNGFTDLAPGLDWSWGLTELRHLVTLATKLSWNQRWNASVDWTPQTQLSLNGALSAAFVDSDEERTSQYMVQGSAGYRFSDALEASLNLNATWEQGTRREELIQALTLDATGGASWRFAEDWTANFTTGLFWGNDEQDPHGDYLSYLVSAEASMTF